MSSYLKDSAFSTEFYNPNYSHVKEHLWKDPVQIDAYESAFMSIGQETHGHIGKHTPTQVPGNLGTIHSFKSNFQYKFRKSKTDQDHFLNIYECKFLSMVNKS